MIIRLKEESQTLLESREENKHFCNTAIRGEVRVERKIERGNISRFET